MKNASKQFVALVLSLAMLFCMAGNAKAEASIQPTVEDISTDKGIYDPGEQVLFTVDIQNSQNSPWIGTLHIDIMHLEKIVDSIDSQVSIDGNSLQAVDVIWTTPNEDFTGYLVKAYLDGSSSAVTAVDCSSDFTVFPRYGYIADYPNGEDAVETQSMIQKLSQQYHINAFQLYDWMWRHDTLIAKRGSTPAASWSDLFGRTIYSDTVSNYIQTIHEVNGAAMAYVMSYAAREGYTDFGIDPSAGLYTDQSHLNQLNVDFGDGKTYLWLFNPADERWQNIMIAQYIDAINTMNFDGLQIDQMGQRNNVYDYRGQKVYLEDTFSSFINHVKSKLKSNDNNRDAVTFNIVDGTVDGWASYDVSKRADTDFDFSEIWWLSNSYNDIKNYVEQVRTNNGGKALVLAAYMNYNDNCGELYEAEKSRLNGVSVNNDHTGYSGSGFVDGFDKMGDSVTFTVNVPENGLYSFVFQYANSTGTAATRTVSVDGKDIDRVSFNSMSSWDEWAHDANCSTYLSAGVHTVQVSYTSGCNGAINLDSMTLGTFDIDSVRLANAAFAASGASHIELGAGAGWVEMLSHEYYPMNAKAVRSDLLESMRRHYDFITAYENLLYDSDINYGDTGTQYVSIKNEKTSGSGEAGKIWTITRQTDDYDILHLINLTGENDTEWRNTTGSPIRKENLELKYYIGSNEQISGVYLASPDDLDCETTELEFTYGSDDAGTYIAFVVPSLEYWDMIYMRRSISSGINKYEAETGLKTNVAVNTDHQGYSGYGFVDSFETRGDSVGFTVSVPEGGDYTLRFGYANGASDEATRSIIVDGKYANKAHFIAGSSWDDWATVEVGVNLSAGVHTVVVYYGDYENGAINLDYMEVEPLIESARSLYLNNWENLVAIWQDTVVNQMTAVNTGGPGLYELRYYDGTAEGNYNVNNIRNYSTFLRDGDTGKTYTDGSLYSSYGYFDDGGILINSYNSYDDMDLPVRLTKSYAMVPHEQVIIVKYELTNPSSENKTIDILDMLHLNNASDSKISTSYLSSDDAIFADMSTAGQPCIAHGILSDDTAYSWQVADDTESSVTAAACSPWHTFDSNGTLNENSSVTCQDVSTGYTVSVKLSPGETRNIYFYVAAAESMTSLHSVVSRVRSNDGEEWISNTRKAYAKWLDEGKTLALEDQKLNDAYDSISVFMKQSIVPGTDERGNIKFAAFPATTNPSAYSYKVWARDSAVTAMSLDATGHTAEAENYWYWLADRQITTDEGDWKKPGTFWTCYWIWDNGPVSFVEPEFDSIGMFLVGAYKHYEQLTGSAKKEFLEKIWPAYRRSADYVLGNITASGFGPADCSIWEEQTEYNGFTQALYVAGLDAAQHMAKACGLQSVADMYNGGASTIRTAILRDDTAGTPGLWNTESNRFNRAVNMDGTPNKLYDSSSDVLISYGVVDAESSRAKSHIDAIIRELGHDTYGVARYENDGFYHRMPWDPGGNEAFEDEPSWPQMAMWIAMYEMQSGYDSYRENAYERLKWFVSRTATGYMPQGECFSNVTLKPHLSTMCEPITGASYLMAAMAYSGKYDMRVYSPEVNAGAYGEITVNSGCFGDWTQWAGLPYYTDPLGDNVADGGTSYDLKRVYAANDSDNIYLRLDLKDWELPGYQESDVFAVQVYAGQTDSAAQSSMVSLTNDRMDHAMSYMVMRSSDSDDYQVYCVENGSWAPDGSISSVAAPQWEVSSGRIELVVPYKAVGNSNPTQGDWMDLRIVILAKTQGSWVEADTFDMHYRMTDYGDEWLKGNFQ